MTLVEVLAALAILGVAALGLVGTMIIAFNGNALAARRTIASQFAQARLERLITQTRYKIPTALTTAPIDCSKMTAGTSFFTAGFDPSQLAPGTGGWMLDVIDGGPPGGAGDDPLFGPVTFDDSTSGTADGTLANTLTARAAMWNLWSGGTQTGCADPMVTTDAGLQVKVPAYKGAATALLCREIHIEPYSLSGAPMLRAWVRVIHGGPNWQANMVMLQEDIAQ